VSTLQRLATALGVPITSFFAEPVERMEVLITRSDERIRSGSGSVVLESIGYGLEQQACDPFMVTLKPGASSGTRMMMHSGHELVFCLEGELDYEISGEHHRLAPGDALLFHADLPHRWHNPTSEPCVFMLVMQVVEERHEPIDQHLHP
jgi:quercetin dioxygenase-like cupin family protein